MHSNCNLQSIKRALLFSIISIILVSCGFQGRKYTTGHYWEGHIEENKNVKEKEIKIKVVRPRDKECISVIIDTTKLPLFQINANGNQIDQKRNSIGSWQHDSAQHELKTNNSQAISDTTAIKEIKALNKKFNKSGFIFLGSGLFSTLIIHVIRDYHLGSLFNLASTVLALCIALSLLALIYNGIITHKLIRKLRKHRENLHDTQWITLLKVKVFLTTLFVYLPVFMIVCYLMAFLVWIVSDSI